MENYRNIGKLVASFGLEGEMVLQHHLGKKTSLKGLKVIFLEEKKNEMLPWFVESARIKSETELHLKLEGVHTRESSRKLLQKEVWLAEEDFLRFAGAAAPISLVGFRMIQLSGEPSRQSSRRPAETDLGEILEVIEQPHQVLCKIDLEGKEALIPIHEGTLRKMDKKTRTIWVILPDGLLDIYRGI